MALGSPASLTGNWTSTSDPCTGAWTGITCNSTSGLPIALDLSYLGLGNRSLPDPLQWVASLQSIKLVGTQAAGTLPPSWSSLTALTFLSLQSNSLVGTLPTQWSALQSLRQLNLATNLLTSSIPAAWGAGLTALTKLVLSSNTLMCGQLPAAFSAAGVASTTSTRIGSACPSPPPPPPSSAGWVLALRSAVTPASWPAGFTGWTTTSDPCLGGVPWTGVSCTGSSITSVDISYSGLQVWT